MYRLSKSDLRKLDDLGRETFRKHLTGEGGYEIVSAPGPGTLVLRTRLTNVWLAFSNNSVRSARSYTLGDYVLKMTLEAVLLDAETNEVLAIVSDRQGRRVNSTLRRVTSVEAWREARRAFDFWATRIRQGIDERAAPSAP